MLSDNVLITPVPKSTRKYQALAYWHEKHYLTVFTLEQRIENPLTLFAVITTTYITHESRHLTAYQVYASKIRESYNR